MKRPDEQDRPLFDPSRMRAADLREPSDAQRAAQQAAAVTHDAAAHVAAPGSQESAPLTVTRLNQLIRGALASAFPSTIHVVGELSNVTAAGTGHRYFTLKDGTGELRCVMWRSDALRLKFNLTDGLEVIASGKVDVYEQRGHVQLYVKRVQPRGVGALELAFRQLR